MFRSMTCFVSTSFCCCREICRKQENRFLLLTLFDKMSLLKRNLYVLNHCLNGAEMCLCSSLNQGLGYLYFKYQL